MLICSTLYFPVIGSDVVLGSLAQQSPDFFDHIPNSKKFLSMHP